MRTLFEETEELLSRARHLEGKHANAMPSDYRTRLIKCMRPSAAGLP